MRTGATKVITVLSVAICVAIVVFGFIAFSNNSRLSPELEELLQNSSCADTQDRDLCLFLAVWSSSPAYTLNASEAKNDQTITHQLASDDQRNFHLTIDGPQARQTIYKDGFVYAFNGHIWQHQQIDQASSEQFRESSQLSFIKLDNFGNFSRSGQEKCFEQNCQVYEFNGQEYTTKVWVNADDFRLQRVLVQGEQYSYNATIDYNSEVQIAAPEGSQITASTQQLAPGGGQISSAQTSEPGLAASGDNSLPATGDSGNPEDYQRWLEQRQ